MLLALPLIWIVQSSHLRNERSGECDVTEWSWGILEDVDSLLEINLVQHNILVALVILLEVKNESEYNCIDTRRHACNRTTAHFLPWSSSTGGLAAAGAALAAAAGAADAVAADAGTTCRNAAQ